jgi:hypothetical protein
LLVRSAIALQLSRLSSCCAPAGSPSVSSHTHKAQCLFILSFGLENYFFNVDISFMMIEAGAETGQQEPHGLSVLTSQS